MQPVTAKTALQILRRKEVERRTRLSRSSIYAAIHAGKFPRPVSLGARAVGWVEDEIEAWLQSRIDLRQLGVKP